MPFCQSNWRRSARCSEAGERDFKQKLPRNSDAGEKDDFRTTANHQLSFHLPSRFVRLRLRLPFQLRLRKHRLPFSFGSRFVRGAICKGGLRNHRLLHSIRDLEIRQHRAPSILCFYMKLAPHARANDMVGPTPAKRFQILTAQSRDRALVSLIVRSIYKKTATLQVCNVAVKDVRD